MNPPIPTVFSVRYGHTKCATQNIFGGLWTYCKVKGLRSCRNLEQLWKILNCLVKFEVFQNFGPKIRWQYWFFRLINVNLLFLPQEIYRVPIWFHPLPILSNCYRKIDKKLLFAHKIRSCHKELTSFWTLLFSIHMVCLLMFELNSGFFNALPKVHITYLEASLEGMLWVAFQKEK